MSHHLDYDSALRKEAGALADAARGAFDRPVAGCPGWTVRDLVAHTGEVHRFWSQVAQLRLQNRTEAAPPEVPPDDALLDWYREGAEHLADVLRTADPSTPVWTWAHRKDIGFVRRRMAQETAVHRWDAQDAVGEPRPIDRELATDGIDEFLDTFIAATEGGPGGRGETIHLHRTDGDGEWVIELSADGARVRRGHQKGDAAVRGAASDLLLWLWGRTAAPSPALETFGDASLLERFRRWVDTE